MFMIIDDGKVIEAGGEFLTFDTAEDAKEWALDDSYLDVIVVKFEGFV